MPKGASGEFVEVWGSRRQHTTQHKVADIRNRCGDARVWGWRCSLTWEGNHPAQRNYGNSGVLEVAQAPYLSQEFMSEDQFLEGTSPYIGTRTQGLGWRKLRDASMASSHQAPSVPLTQTRIDCKVRMGRWGPGVDWAAPFLKSLTELFLFLTWLPRRHKFIVKWIIEREQFEFSPRQLCLKDSFLRKKFLGFNIPFQPTNSRTFFPLSCLPEPPFCKSGWGRPLPIGVLGCSLTWSLDWIH